MQQGRPWRGRCHQPGVGRGQSGSEAVASYRDSQNHGDHGISPCSLRLLPVPYVGRGNAKSTWLQGTLLGALRKEQGAESRSDGGLGCFISLLPNTEMAAM